MENAPTYSLEAPASVEIPDAVTLVHFEASFPKGQVSPKSEQEEQALEHLVSLGFAARSAIDARASAPTDDKE